MHRAGILDPSALLRFPQKELATLIKPSGYYNQKAEKLHNLVKWLVERTGGEIDLLKSFDTGALRDALLSIKGIGKETADDMLLYALEKPVFVVDTYTYRIAVRHGWAPLDAGYEELAGLFSENIPNDINIYKNYHAIIVEVGKTFCKKRSPLCDDCPGKPLLPDNTSLEII